MNLQQIQEIYVNQDYITVLNGKNLAQLKSELESLQRFYNSDYIETREYTQVKDKITYLERLIKSLSVQQQVDRVRQGVHEFLKVIK